MAVNIKHTNILFQKNHKCLYASFYFSDQIKVTLSYPSYYEFKEILEYLKNLNNVHRVIDE